MVRLGRSCVKGSSGWSAEPPRGTLGGRRTEGRMSKRFERLSGKFDVIVLGAALLLAAIAYVISRSTGGS